MRFLVQNHSGYPVDPGASAADAILQQEAAGCDIVTDGELDWAEPISSVAAALDGLRVGVAQKYFSTTATFRQPVVTGTIRRSRPILVDAFRAASRITQRSVKPVLPGPYTLARAAELSSGPYHSIAAVGEAFSEALALEVGDLAAAGARWIQLDEPAILHHPQDIRLLRELFEPLWAARGAAQIILATYLADAEPLYAQLNSVPADVVGLDLISAPRLYEVIRATGASKILALGVVDGRRGVTASAQQIAADVTRLLKHYDLPELHLLPSCSLSLCPPLAARTTLQQLHAACSLLQATA
jgi:5-methyltetrahydropteroyltriglutamate--homocysteine methyltransferase